MDAAGAGAGAAAAAKGGERMEATEKLLNSVRNYATMLYLGTMVVGIAPLLAYKYAPEAAAAAGAYLDDPWVIAAVFTAATVLLQGRLARVLERKPAPAPRLTPPFAWPLAVTTWGFITMFFLSFLAIGGEYGLMRHGGDWVVAAVASAWNLAMAVLTVSERCLAFVSLPWVR